MTRLTAVTKPANSLVLVLDPVHGAIPTSMGGRSIASTDSCVAVGTLSAADGETEIQLIDDLSQDEQPGDLTRVWTQELSTPSGSIAVADVLGTTFVETKTSSRTLVSIFTNDENEPDKIWVVVG